MGDGIYTNLGKWQMGACMYQGSHRNSQLTLCHRRQRNNLVVESGESQRTWCQGKEAMDETFPKENIRRNCLCVCVC